MTTSDTTTPHIINISHAMSTMADDFTACATCGVTFLQILADPDPASADGWTFHHASATDLTVVAETCSAACATAFEAKRTVRVECDCATCEVNARIVKRPFPLRADVNALMHGALVGKSGRLGKQATHSLVELANHPTLGPALAQSHGPWAVA